MEMEMLNALNLPEEALDGDGTLLKGPAFPWKCYRTPWMGSVFLLLMALNGPGIFCRHATDLIEQARQLYMGILPTALSGPTINMYLETARNWNMLEHAHADCRTALECRTGERTEHLYCI
jgi:hypothetical protein